MRRQCGTELLQGVEVYFLGNSTVALAPLNEVMGINCTHLINQEKVPFWCHTFRHSEYAYIYK